MEDVLCPSGHPAHAANSLHDSPAGCYLSAIDGALLPALFPLVSQAILARFRHLGTGTRSSSSGRCSARQFTRNHPPIASITPDHPERMQAAKVPAAADACSSSDRNRHAIRDTRAPADADTYPDDSS
ncbi:MAG TPA: hypothetical protein VIS71_10190 [Terrimicrobium sp.]